MCGALKRGVRRRSNGAKLYDDAILTLFPFVFGFLALGYWNVWFIGC